MNQKYKRYILLFFIILCCNFSSYSQITFDQGYFIDNSGKRTECLIKNVDWKNNPVAFSYKLDEASEVLKATVVKVKEFGISDNVKYIFAEVNIDRSGTQNNELSTQRKPEFSYEKLFLKALVEGEASLYVYTDGSLKRYFYNVTGTEIEQLVYKQYILPDARIVANNYYKQQLIYSFKCDDLKQTDFSALSCTKNALVRIFEEYNSCKQSTYKVYKRKKELKSAFNLSLQLGFANNEFSMENSDFGSKTTFDAKIGFRPSIEVEYLLPFNRNKWSIFIAPTYQSYDGHEVVDIAHNNIDFEYSSIEIPVGLRHYFFLNNESKFFVNGFGLFDVLVNSKLRYEGFDLNMYTSSTISVGVGVGFKFKERYSAAVNYLYGRKLLRNYVKWKSNYDILAFTFGYTLFK